MIPFDRSYIHVLSCTVSEIYQDTGHKLPFHLPHSVSPLGVIPSEYHPDLWCKKARVPRLLQSIIAL